MDGLSQRFARYLVKACNLSPTTVFTYEQGLLRLERFTNKDRIDITPTDLQAFLLSDYHPTTKVSTLVAIRSFHRYGALVENRWQLNGIMHVRGPRVIRQAKPALTPAEARQLLGLCRRSNEYRVIYLGLYGGLRVTESASITSAEWRADRLRFIGKGRKERDVPLHPELEAAKGMILSNTPSRDTLKHVCRSLSFYSGIPFTSHTLRRTFAVTLSEAEVNRDVIGDLLGHSPQSVLVAHYVPVRWSEKTGAMACLEY